MMVTGPSLTSDTAIIAPNSPVSTLTPSFRTSERNSSYSRFASSGAAARMNDGRRPDSVSASSVNCEMTSSSPPTWRSARFILPAASANTRRPRVLSAMYAASFSVSSFATPSRMTKPRPMLPMTSLATRTSAWETRCRTARIVQLLELTLENSLLVSDPRRAIIMSFDDSGSLQARPDYRLQLRHDDGAGLFGRRLRHQLGMQTARAQPRLRLLDGGVGGYRGHRVFAPVLGNRQLPRLRARPVVDHFLGLRLRVVWRPDRRPDVVILRRAILQNPLLDRRRYGRPRAGDWPGAGSYRMSSVGRRRLGHADHAAMGCGLSQCDRGMERQHGVEARCAEPPGL